MLSHVTFRLLNGYKAHWLWGGLLALSLHWIWSNNVTDTLYSTTTQTNTRCHKTVSSCKVVTGTLSACEVNVGFNPLVSRLPFQSWIRWHGCLGGRQLPDGSHVTLSQQVWWRFSWQVGSLGGVSTVSVKVVLEWWWHSELILPASNLYTSLSCKPWTDCWISHT